MTAAAIDSTGEAGIVAPRPPSSTPEEDAREAALFDIKIFKKRAARPIKSSAWGSAYLAPKPPQAPTQAPTQVPPPAAVVISEAAESADKAVMADESIPAAVAETDVPPQEEPAAVDESMIVDAEGA